MSNEEILKKYNQLIPEYIEKVDKMLEQLASRKIAQKGENSVPLFGLLKGKIKMAPDFLKLTQFRLPAFTNFNF